MANEFRGIPVLTGSNFQSGEDILVFYEIDGVNTGNDMIVLAGYCLFIHLLSCVVLTWRYRMHGKFIPIDDKQEKVIRMTHDGLSTPFSPVPEADAEVKEEKEGEM